jgi:RraA family protein
MLGRMENTTPPPAALASAEMHPGPGFRVRTDVDRSAAGLATRFRHFPTPDISDRMNRLFTMHHAIGPLTDERLRLTGPAVTAKVFPGDNLMVHKAMDIAQPGDVIVVDTSASHMTAVLGDMICTKAHHRGVAGFVVDGLVRDLDGILELGTMPVFARGTTPIGPLHRGPGEVNHPVACGGVVVHPGDIVVGDADGVVVVPKDVARTVLDDLEAGAEAAQRYLGAVQRGDFSNAWVDRVLAAGGLTPDDHPPADPGP